MFLLIILLLSGCSVEYNLTINEDNTISETVIAKEKTRRMESLTNLKGKQAVTYLYDMFKRKDENINFNYIEDDIYTYATASTSHNNIDKYCSRFSSDVFNNIEIQKKDENITINIYQSKLLGEGTSYSLIYDDITVNIKIPYLVTENNADSVKGDVYTWYIRDSKDLKNINITYKESSKKDNVSVKINDKTYNINYGIIVVSVIIIVVSIIVLFVYIKNRKNNTV